MTLAQNSPIMMLDEPTTYLDLPNQLETLALLRQLNQVHKKNHYCGVTRFESSRNVL